jgi:hypothetical protein
MLGFLQYISESLATEKLKHLEHAEDHVINAGKEGFSHAIKTLEGTHKALSGKKSSVKITTKYDGAPSIVFGTNPANGKFFVASKSAFNKNPKLNYTKADIEKNHGHAPGLVSKLSQALEHLPKVTPKGKVYQGDMMYTKDDVEEREGKYHFKPNTITYSTPKDSAEGKKIKNAKVGVAVHTEYKGKDLESMKAQFAPGTSAFKGHKDVHVIDVAMDNNPEYGDEAKSKFKAHLDQAKKLNQGHDYSHVTPHLPHVKTYINSLVTSNEKPSYEGFKAHVQSKMSAAEGKLKSEKGKAKAAGETQSALSHIADNKENFNRTFAIHHHIQQAKQELVKSLSSGKGDKFEHSIDGRPTGPEGHVAVLNNMPTKLVDRSPSGFAAANRVGGGIKAIRANQ